MGPIAIQGQGWLQNPVSQFTGCLSSSGVPPWRRGLTKTELDFLKVYLFGCARSWLQHTGCSIFMAARRFFSCDLWDLVP